METALTMEKALMGEKTIVEVIFKGNGSVLDSETFNKKTGCGKLYVTCNKNDNGEIVAVSAMLGKSGGCAASQTEAIGSLATVALAHGADIGVVISAIKGISCHSPAEGGLSCADAIAKAIEQANS